MKRAPTLSEHACRVAEYTDTLIDAARTGDLDEIEVALEEVWKMRPPHGINPVTALAMVLIAQIDRDVPWEQRLAWVEEFDPAASLEPSVVAACQRGEAA